jgi:hypothetical protein
VWAESFSHTQIGFVRHDLKVVPHEVSRNSDLSMCSKPLFSVTSQSIEEAWSDPVITHPFEAHEVN